MNSLNAQKIGFATGITSCAIYLGCFLVMLVIGKEGLVKLSNLLFHGMDFSNIIRMDVPLSETVLGLLLSFLFWGISGYIFAFIYNKLVSKTKI